MAATTQYTTAAIAAEAGIVSTHAHTIRPAIPQRTADKRGLHVNLAVGYGGRKEITDAMRSIVAAHHAEGRSLEDLAERAPNHSHQQDKSDQSSEGEDEGDVRMIPNGEHDGSYEPKLGDAHHPVAQRFR